MIAIRTTNLKKVYRLYTRPSYRFRDMFGLLGNKPGAFTERAALDGVSLEIRRGEKVAIIGRNGAGKSTFLKLVTNVIQPTSGTLDVKGVVHALLQIGTGFHPDFTGRENVYAYFAQRGMTGAAADRACAEVVEFAELEEYIDQPMKTYSTGMTVRLMFSASTAITPDLLVLDEVLGVGDAYFAHKSYERIRGLSAASGTTLLLVTHDVYTAAKVCDRMIWLDHGRILIDDVPDLVINAYEDSIRRQEERRLRLKRLAGAPDARPTSSLLPMIVELRSRDNRALPCQVFISRLSLAIEGTAIDSLPIGVPRTGTADLIHEGTAWGEAVQWQGRLAQAWNNYGSVFHKVAGLFDVGGLMNANEVPPFTIEVECWSDAPCDVAVQAFVGDREFHLAELTTAPRAWQSIAACSVDGRRRSDAERARNLTIGSGRIVITDIRCLDGAGRVKSIFAHGEPFILSVEYRINEPNFKEDVQLLATFHRDGVHDTCRMFCRALGLDAGRGTSGTLEMRLPRMCLGAGKYTVSFGITERGYFEREQVLFYSINPGMYDCLTRGFEIEVVDGGIVGRGTGVVADAEWHVVGDSEIEYVRHGDD
jgi:ABC-type polysaccharide/polyol phosphate transport system ATPase subunit